MVLSGTEMKRQEIVQYFYRYLKRDPDGNYLIEIENDRCYVEVEDAPYVIKRVSALFQKTRIGRILSYLSTTEVKKELNLNPPSGREMIMSCIAGLRMVNLRHVFPTRLLSVF